MMAGLSVLFRSTLLAFAWLTLVACSGSDDADSYNDEYASVSDTGFDEASLPDDFPKDLIPDDYNNAVHTIFGQVESATFENRDPVEETIRHYTELIGDPLISVGDAGGDRSVQWHTKPWAVSILGNDDESIVVFVRIDD